MPLPGARGDVVELDGGGSPGRGHGHHLRFQALPTGGGSASGALPSDDEFEDRPGALPSIPRFTTSRGLSASSSMAAAAAATAAEGRRDGVAGAEFLAGGGSTPLVAGSLHGARARPSVGPGGVSSGPVLHPAVAVARTLQSKYRQSNGSARGGIAHGGLVSRMQGRSSPPEELPAGARRGMSAGGPSRRSKRFLSRSVGGGGGGGGGSGSGSRGRRAGNVPDFDDLVADSPSMTSRPEVATRGGLAGQRARGGAAAASSPRGHGRGRTYERPVDIEEVESDGGDAPPTTHHRPTRRELGGGGVASSLFARSPSMHRDIAAEAAVAGARAADAAPASAAATCATEVEVVPVDSAGRGGGGASATRAATAGAAQAAEAAADDAGMPVKKRLRRLRRTSDTPLDEPLGALIPVILAAANELLPPGVVVFRLALNHNRLEALPPNFHQLAGLGIVQLYLGHNPFVTLPAVGLAALGMKLKSLMLDCCLLAGGGGVPGDPEEGGGAMDVDALPSPTGPAGVLSLAHNRLAALPASFGAANRALTHLDLSHNALVYPLPRSFARLPVEYLNIQRNAGLTNTAGGVRGRSMVELACALAGSPVTG
ncbi:hypothetical protein I4F81_001069 [Pyropia yezoensis]|uniref:Uncharacterized protein n=1 Tax=Pyropia yezoensis TaxID=2788 RepID=A0ACC3BKI8_PYRYE|nr:hypothetical protein I4F81_001069 [Neopyropia yezoensis]